MSTEPQPGEESFADLVVGLRAGVPELAPPPSLLPDLRRRYARRSALRRAGYAAVPVALVVAIGATAIPHDSPAPRAQPASTPVVHDAAYVTAQVSKALTDADQDILVESRSVTVTASGQRVASGQHATMKNWLSMRTGQIHTVEDIDGQPDFESGLSAPGDFTAINYPKHTYFTWPAEQQHPELPHGTFTAEEIHAAMASGKLSITARDQQVDGKSTIELTGDIVPKDEQGTNNAQAQPQRFWVDDATYLPVRSQYQDGDGNWLGTVDYDWLPPTAANEALLTLKIPSGLTKSN